MVSIDKNTDCKCQDADLKCRQRSELISVWLTLAAGLRLPASRENSSDAMWNIYNSQVSALTCQAESVTNSMLLARVQCPSGNQIAQR